jgi:hypothetical protein
LNNGVFLRQILESGEDCYTLLISIPSEIPTWSIRECGDASAGKDREDDLKAYRKTL